MPLGKGQCHPAHSCFWQVLWLCLDLSWELFPLYMPAPVPSSLLFQVTTNRRTHSLWLGLWGRGRGYTWIHGLVDVLRDLKSPSLKALSHFSINYFPSETWAAGAEVSRSFPHSQHPATQRHVCYNSGTCNDSIAVGSPSPTPGLTLGVFKSWFVQECFHLHPPL